MEYIPCGTLESIIHTFGNIAEGTAVHYARTQRLSFGGRPGRGNGSGNRQGGAEGISAFGLTVWRRQRTQVHGLFSLCNRGVKWDALSVICRLVTPVMKRSRCDVLADRKNALPASPKELHSAFVPGREMDDIIIVLCSSWPKRKRSCQLSLDLGWSRRSSRLLCALDGI